VLGPGRMVRGLLLVLRQEAIIVDATLEYRRHCADSTDSLGELCAPLSVAQSSNVRIASEKPVFFRSLCWLEELWRAAVWACG
jgi:hypothetical protein